MTPLYYLDKKISFQRYKKDLFKLKSYQLFLQRYGLGKTISNTLVSFIGIHPSHFLEEVRYNEITQHIANVFSNSIDHLDSSLEREMVISLERYIDVYNYRGSRYIEELPLHGQRRRTNGNTCKVVRPLKTVHLASHIRRKHE